MPKQYTTTFGQRVHSFYPPPFYDPENYPLQIVFSNPENYYLNLYAVKFGDEIGINSVRV